MAWFCFSSQQHDRETTLLGGMIHVKDSTVRQIYSFLLANQLEPSSTWSKLKNIEWADQMRIYFKPSSPRVFTKFPVRRPGYLSCSQP
jgi:hypothetical protein